MGDVPAVQVDMRLGERRCDGEAGQPAAAGLEAGEAGDFQGAEGVGVGKHARDF